jgi:hypothetical protein
MVTGFPSLPSVRESPPLPPQAVSTARAEAAAIAAAEFLVRRDRTFLIGLTAQLLTKRRHLRWPRSFAES